MQTKAKVDKLNLYPYYAHFRENQWRLKQLAFTIVPVHTFLPFQSEIETALIKVLEPVTRFRYRNARDVLINIGAGSQGNPGWINVDIRRSKGINCLYDCRRRLPFQDESARGIFCEHFLEHLDYTEEVPYFLSECRRVLRKDGILRIVVPDAEKYLRAYCSPGWDELARIRPLTEDRYDAAYGFFKYNTKMELINMVFRQGFEHKYAYDHENLEFLLQRYGFSQVERQRFGVSMISDVCIDNPYRATESLYVDALK